MKTYSTGFLTANQTTELLQQPTAVKYVSSSENPVTQKVASSAITALEAVKTEAKSTLHVSQEEENSTVVLETTPNTTSSDITDPHTGVSDTTVRNTTDTDTGVPHNTVANATVLNTTFSDGCTASDFKILYPCWILSVIVTNLCKLV